MFDSLPPCFTRWSSTNLMQKIFPTKCKYYLWFIPQAL
jgi:hypothetical protein